MTIALRFSLLAHELEELADLDLLIVPHNW